ncbi:MFS transporter [Granulicoccus phenolivorans]|uniref:MFS transporter n=1 Tax=Granulicoccus phenolivorans TaxID=266854 RepID=UPI000425C6F2|nr:MFS transporter [Granulicoccus phenolivorans]
MTKPRWSAWQVVFGFGLVSLFADMVYEGARSLYGPALLALGASAAVVGLVTGAGEAMALVLRLFAGPIADRRGAHWSFTIVGYGLTAVCVPLLAVTPRLGAAGLLVGSLLILAERAGKAVRSPSKSALLAQAARSVGRGKGFGVHKALDQLGAFSGPLLVAAIVAFTGSIWTGLAWLAVPGAIALVILLVIRRAVPDPTVYDPKPSAAAKPAPQSWWRAALGANLPGAFFGYAIAMALTTGGLVTFAVLSVHLSRQGVPTAAIPVVYAGAMLVEAIAALLTGWAFDRLGSRVLLVVPILVALVPALAFGPVLGVTLVGVAVWALAYGIQDSTIKALVADLVPAHTLASAYGIFAAIQGVFAIGGGFLAGYLLDRSVPALIVVIAVAQAVALVLLIITLRRVHRAG